MSRRSLVGLTVNVVKTPEESNHCIILSDNRYKQSKFIEKRYGIMRIIEYVDSSGVVRTELLSVSEYDFLCQVGTVEIYDGEGSAIFWDLVR